MSLEPLAHDLKKHHLVIAAANELGINVIGYSPLGRGVPLGKADQNIYIGPIIWIYRIPNRFLQT